MATEGSKSVATLEPGQHAFVTFASTAEQMHVLADFVRAGLEFKQRVLYFSDQTSPDDVARSLRRRGIDTDTAIKRGDLTIATSAQGYLSGGRFDALTTKVRWFAAIDETLALGYSVMRVASDLSWAARDIPGHHDLPYYERSIADVFATGRVIGLCEFDRRVFDDATIEQLECIHPGGRCHATPLCDRTDLRIDFTFTPEGAAISGEVDIYNRGFLAGALDSICDAIAGDVHLDLSKLKFIDVGGLSTIARHAAQRMDGSNLVLHGASPHLLRVINLLGWRDLSNVVIVRDERPGR